tara:strand:+ start:57 stop:1439 length:1383 start_codon:yes stop_codon:yes gene_type:complete
MSKGKIARTGRVQNWIDDPHGRLPVSCTVFVCGNEMEGTDGIEASWKFASHALRYGAGVAVHLSELDPKGHERASGVIASGPVSFGRILSILNETLRRGGKFRNGAIVLHYDANCADLYDFVTAPRDVLPWVKRCVNITQEWWDDMSDTNKQALLQAIKAGDVWLNKVKYEGKERIRGNVCLEVYLPHRGTCLLQHINLGACTFDDIPDAFIQGMQQLCDLHSKTGVGETGEYLSPETDRQVGLGVLGLANLLRRYGVTYEQFGRALNHYNNNTPKATVAYELASRLAVGISKASQVARAHNMVRAFAIAPTASCSYRSEDTDGFTCTPEIAPPIARSVDRDSGTFGVKTYDYGEVEIASEVGWDNYKAVADGIMTMYSRSGLLHGYSFNWWSDMVTMDEKFIEEWLRSPQTSLYYSLQVMGDVQDKSDAYAALDGADLEDYLSTILGDATNEPQCDCAE